MKMQIKERPEVHGALGEEALQEMVAASDSGSRKPIGFTKKILVGVTITWAIFQLWIASPIPYAVSEYLPVLNSTYIRSIHLAFAVFLAFLAFPAVKNSPRHYIPYQDWLFAFLGAFCAAYISFFADELAQRSGLPTKIDLIVSGAGLVFLLEATRRSLGLPMTIVALVFLSYIFFGHLAPDVIAWKGASFSKAFSHQWLTQEGVFGIGLGVSSGFVFMFVLFGALLEKTGAGEYFIRIAFAALGHFRGGPAKAAVLSSAMTGMISGSSIANVVTTGTFTIPMMKKAGFTSERAGAVEVASSVNGQIMPPVMGAAAFLMVEYVGIPYFEVVKHAFLPAAVSYIALLYIVHLEALKEGMKGTAKVGIAKSTIKKVQSFVIGIIVTALLSGLIYFIGGIAKPYLSSMPLPLMMVLILAAYVSLLRYSSMFADLEDGLSSETMTVREISRTGLHYVLPIILLIWLLIVERKSAGLAAFWATSLLIVILVTQRSLKNYFRKESLAETFQGGLRDLWGGLATGSRNMIGIGIATATAGIIVGTVSLTGIGQVMAEFVELVSGGSLILMLVMVAFISLILGMGLPTTANYIVVSSLMAGVIVELGAQSGLVVPLIAVHLFVFYFGIMADVTPPVGLASFAAAAVSGGDPLKTGVASFFYSLRTVALPFIFIFNTDLLLINVTWSAAIFVFFTATIGMLVFTAATQGYFVSRSRYWESGILLLVAFTMVRPGFWLNQFEPEYLQSSGSQVVALAKEIPQGEYLRLVVEGERYSGDTVRKTVLLPMGEQGEGKARLFESAGIEIREENKQVFIDNIVFSSPAQVAGLDFDWRILTVETLNDRLPKQMFYVPALILLLIVYIIQRRRRKAEIYDVRSNSIMSET